MSVSRRSSRELTWLVSTALWFAFALLLRGQPVAARPGPAPTSVSSDPVPGATPGVPLLTLDEALASALTGNRGLQNSRLEVVKAKKNVASFKSNFYPKLEAELKTGALLTPVSVNFPRASMGTFPIIGPVPANDINVTTPTKLTTYFVIAVRQPITQLPRIALRAKTKEIDVALAAEEVRAQRESLVTDVKKAYYCILQTEAALAAAADSVRFYRELERTVLDKYAQRTVLKSDVLDVRKHLAEAEYDLAQQQDALATNKSQLNLLLGRDIHLDFTVEPVGESRISPLTLPEIEKIALAQRPQIRQAILRTKQAELDKRLAAAEYAPDLNLSVTYIQPYNVGLLPDRIVSVGAEMTWQPITWGKVLNDTQAKAQAVLQAQNNEKQVSDQVLVEVGSLYRTLHTDQERVKAARIALEAAQESLRVATVRYQQKTVLLQDVYETQARVASATRNYLESVLAVNVTQAELEQAIGED